MSAIVPLARLERVALREAWPDEAANFTPWLAEKDNLDQLAEKLGIPLELEKVEKGVGPFSADILAKEPDTERWVLIENQITPTDHRHLGQLLTYAAGLDARTIVWIAEEFREEHRAAIDFLNRTTTEEIAFFGVKVELYKIGESSLACDFTLIAKPNDWSKRTRTLRQGGDGDPTENQRLWMEYWEALIESAKGRYAPLAGRTPYRGNWQTFESIKGGNPSFTLNATFAWDRGLRLEIYIDKSHAKAAFHKLLQHRAEIEKALGQELAWEELPEGQASRLAHYMPGNERRASLGQWDKQHEWLLTWAPRMSEELAPFLTTLANSDSAPDEIQP